MRDYLIDVVKHTLPLAAFNALRVDGSESATEISATESNRQLVLKARLNVPIEEFQGTFGIPNLNQLNTILNIPEYDEDANIEIRTKEENNTQVPFNIHFENKNGDFSNDFRLIGSRVIDSMEPPIRMMIDKWPVSFEPSVAAQQRFKYQLSANPDEKTTEFTVRDGAVKVTLGDGGSHSGGFQFHSGLDPKVKLKISVSSLFVAGVFAMSGDRTIHIGEHGMMVSIDSGLATYDYVIPNITK